MKLCTMCWKNITFKHKNILKFKRYGYLMCDECLKKEIIQKAIKKGECKILEYNNENSLSIR